MTTLTALAEQHLPAKVKTQSGEKQKDTTPKKKPPDEPQPVTPAPEKPAANVQPKPDEQAEPEPQDVEITEAEEIAPAVEDDEEEVVTDGENEFGSTDETFLELDKILAKSGIKPIQKDVAPETKQDKQKIKLVDFVDDSDEALEKELAAWNKELNKISAMPMFNPNLWKSALKIGAIYVQRGINNFADWAKTMTEKLVKNLNLGKMPFGKRWVPFPKAQSLTKNK